jgi:hypothetical protein
MIGGLSIASLLAVAFPVAAHAQATLDHSYQVGFVSDPSKVRSGGQLADNDTVLAVSNTGAATVPSQGLCINAYATKRDDGSVTACCSCPVGTNATRTISVYKDLQISGVSLGSLPFAVELVSTNIESAMTPCNPGTAGSGTSRFANGMAASLYTQSGLLSSTALPRPLIPSTLTQATLTKLTTGCSPLVNKRPKQSQFCNVACGAPKPTAAEALD